MPDEPQSYWLIDEPSPFAPKEVMQQWLWDNNLAIEAAKTDGDRKAFEEAKARVLANLRARHGSGLGERMDPDRT